MACIDFNPICTHLTLGVCKCINGQTCSLGSFMGTKSCIEVEATVDKSKKVQQTKKRKLVEKKHQWGYSTDLMLYDDPWKIKKKLKGSDLGHLTRLLLPKELVEDLMLPVLDPKAERQSEIERGIQVMIWDVDTQSMHNLVFKFWASSRSYVFIDGWIKEFVKRRNLKKDDEIGFHWDPYKNCFDFSVLHHA